jgi:hypothetical protein
MNKQIQTPNSRYLYTLCLLLLVQTVFAQTIDSVQKSTENTPRTKVYHINRLTGGLIILGGLATDYPAIGRIKDKPNLTDAEISSLNPSVIDQFDQWALHQSSSNYMTYSRLSDEVEPPIFILLPAALALDKKIRKDWLDLLFMYCEGHVITFTFYNYSWFGPTFQNRYRPITYYTDLPMGDRTTGNNRNSEYSGHTASVAFTSFYVAKVYCDYHPDMGASKYLIYTAALIPPVAMGYLRVMALAHFPSDDLTGLAIGSLVGIILPELHKFKCPGINLGLMSIPGATGLDVCWTLPSHQKSFN